MKTEKSCKITLGLCTADSTARINRVVFYVWNLKSQKSLYNNETDLRNFHFVRMMMKKKRLLVIILICICGLSCLIFGLLNHRGQPINANEAFYLNEKEIIELSEKAKNGDGEASLSLAGYYDFIKYDREKAAEWYKLGADNGNVICQYNYAYYLLSKNQENNDENNTEEAVIYLKMAAKNGSEAARRKLERLGISN